MRRLFFIFLVLFPLSLAAAETEYAFHHFRASQGGLSFDDVKCLAQDQSSNMWIGTRYGLNRYDGTNFRNYFKEDLGTGSDFIRCLHVDRDGNLWVGTGSGMAVYDMEKDVFRNPSPEIDEQIICMVPDSRGNIWMGTEGYGTVFMKSADVGIRTYRLYDSSVSKSIPRIAINNNDDIVLYVYCDNLYMFDPDSGELKPLGQGVLQDWFKGDDIGSMIFSQKSNDVLYVLGKRSGLCEVNLKQGTVKQLYSVGGNSKFTSMRMDGEKNLWLASTSGLIRYNLITGRSMRLYSDKNDKFSLSDNNITCSFQDNQDNLWVASAYEGLNCAARNHARFHKHHSTVSGNSLEGCNIKGAVQDREGTVWIASESMGLLAFDPESGKVEEVGRKYNLPELTSICEDSGELWLGSRAGIYRLDPKTGRKKFYSHFLGSDYRVLALLTLHSGDILAGTTGGLMQYDRKSDSFEKIPGIECSNADVLVQDSFGTVWMATYSLGVYAYDVRNHSGIRHMNEGDIPNAISYVMVDEANDDVWAMSFGSGFFKYDRKAGAFIKYDKKSIASLPSNIFYSALPDQKGHLWLASDKGLVSFNPSLSSAKCLGVSNGLLDDIYSPVALKLMSGEFFFASKNGFVTFNPADINDSGKHINAEITQLSISAEPVIPGKDAPIDRNIDMVEKIHLGPRNNSFSISLACPENMFSPDIMYTFLEGVDQSLREVPASGAVDYYGLPHGSHTLRFFSIDPEGRQYEIHQDILVVVDPPFWSSRTGVSLIALIALGLVSLMVLLILRTARRRQKGELDEFRRASEAAALQEKMSFFSNIIHEIKTPLMLIRTPLKNLISTEGLPDESKEELRIIESSSDSMDRLVKELLEFVRVEERGYVITRQNIDIVDRIGFLCFNFSDAVKARNLRLDFTHEEESITVAVDNQAIDKILGNLLSNAVKFAETLIKVNVSTSGEKLLVRISNDGQTIPEERRNDIFKPFVLFRDDTAPYTPGFGIGLALASTLTGLHGGTLRLTDSEMTEFVLELPLETVPEALEEDERITESQGEGTTMLIVEDNPELLNYLRQKMEAEYNVIAVTTAEAALKTIEERQVNIVLTDIGLSKMSGIQLCKKISSDFSSSHIPVVIISAISSETTKIKCMESGAAIYIEKPFTIEYLNACVNSILSKREVLKSVYGMSEKSESEDLSSFGIVDRDAEFLHNLEEVVTANISDDSFSVKQLENELLMSHTALYKKMMGLLNTSPVDYIRSKRLAIAAQLIRSNASFISEVCYKVGFSSPSYFTKCFRDAYGMAPSEYAKKYSKDKNE